MPHTDKKERHHHKKPFSSHKKLFYGFTKTLSGRVFLGLILGIIIGITFNIFAPWGEHTRTVTQWLAFPGYLFLAVLKMIILPLILSTVFTGIAGSPNDTIIKKVGWRIILYFIITTTVAISIGLGLVFLLSPGAYLPPQTLPMAEATAHTSIKITNWAHALANILPHNIFNTLSKGDLLKVVLFSAIFGAASLQLNKTTRAPLLNIAKALQDVCMVIVSWVMQLAPYAVFGLITQVVSTTGVDVLWGMSAYMGVVLLGLLIMYSVYLTLITFFGHIPLSSFIKNIKEAQILAFSTSSSASVMPLTIQTAEEKLGVNSSITRFVIPLGATINMDGTALYQAVAAGFLAQVYGIPLGSAEFLLIILTALGASIGASGTPGVGIVMLSGILAKVGIPVEGIALILGVDRVLDMCRTTLNISGDLVASVIMHRLLGKKLHPQKSN